MRSAAFLVTWAVLGSALPVPYTHDRTADARLEEAQVVGRDEKRHKGALRPIGVIPYSLTHPPLSRHVTKDHIQRTQMDEKDNDSTYVDWLNWVLQGWDI